MKEFCPNKASKEFKELASIFGEDKAYFLWMRNKGNELDKAPNGAESKLFLTLLDYFNGNRTEALKAKAKVYSNDFLNWFGDWTGNAVLVKYYGPTMGKTTAVKDNPNLVDFDDIARERIKNLAEEKNLTVRQLKTQSPPEYKQLLLDIIQEWKKSPESAGKTLLVSNAAISSENIYANTPSIPSRSEFIRRLVERGEGDESAAAQYYDDLLSKWNPNLKIDDRYVSDIEGVSKVVDKNGEPLIVWHGGAPDIKIFKNGSNGKSTTETGYYIDLKTGEEIPTDSSRAMFFSSNKHVASSYALLYANKIYRILFNRTQSLISTFYGGSAHISKDYFRSIDDLYDFLDDVAEFNPRFEKLKDYIKRLLYDGKRMPKNAVNAARDLFVKLRSELRDYESGVNLVSSLWDDALEKGRKLIQKYNTSDGILKLIDGEIPDILKKEYQLSQKLLEFRRKNGKDEDGFLETAVAWLSSHGDFSLGDYRLIYNGDTLLFDFTRNPDEKREIPISLLSKEEISLFFNNALKANKESVESRNKDVIKQKYLEKSQRYPVFLAIKNPLTHDYEGTHLGLGYKESTKYPFGYVAARLVKKAIEEGNDGVIYENIYDPYLANNYGVFDPNQIKSATSNKQDIITGEPGFSTEDKNIYHNLTPVSAADEIRKNLVDRGIIHSFKGYRITKSIMNAEQLVCKACEGTSVIPFFYRDSNSTAVEFLDNVTIADDLRDEIERTNDKNMTAVISLARTLQQKIPQLSFEFIRPTELPEGVDKRANSFVKGNKVYLVVGRATTESTVEEFMHPIVYTIQNLNDTLFNSLFEEAKKDFPKLWAEIQDTYTDKRGFNNISRQNELVTQALSRYVHSGYKKAQNRTTVKELVRNALNYIAQLINRAIEMVGGKAVVTPENLPKMKLEELARLIVADDSQFRVWTTEEIQHSISTKQQKAQKVAEQITERFYVLYRAYERMPNKSPRRQQIQNQIFEKFNELKQTQDYYAVTIALDFALQNLGTWDYTTNEPMKADSVSGYLWKQSKLADPYADITPERLVEMYQNSIGFYDNLVSQHIPNNLDDQMSAEDKLKAKEVKDIIDRVIKPMWLQAMAKVGDKIVDDIVDTEVFASDEDKEDMKTVAKDWLHKNVMYGDINVVKSYVYNNSYIDNPIIKQVFHLILHAETKTLEELQPVARRITKAYQKADSLFKKIGPNWQTRLMEFDRNGIPTGKFVRPINYGQYEQDVTEFVKNLNEEFEKDYGHYYHDDGTGMIVNSLTGELADNEEWGPNGEEPAYVKYLKRIEKFKCEHANRRYTLEYYYERMSKPYRGSLDPNDIDTNAFGHGLSPRTLARYNYIQSNINYYLDLCTDHKTGFSYPEKLSTQDKKKLDEWYDLLDDLSNPYRPDGTEKMDDERQMAFEIRAWQKWIGEKLRSEIDLDAFEEEINKVSQEATDSGNPRLLSDFFKYNSQFGINPDFIEQTIGQFPSIEDSDQAVIHAKLIKKSLQGLVKTKTGYTRDLQRMENNPTFWLDCKHTDQIIEDGKTPQSPEFAKVFEDNFTQNEILYRDENGFAIDAFGDPVAPENEHLHNDLLTYREYLIRKYTDIALANPSHTIPGLNDLSGNPIVFSGSADQIRDVISKLFSYKKERVNSEGNIEQYYVPLSVFTMLYPKNDSFFNNRTGRLEKTMLYVPKGRFAEKFDNHGVYMNQQYDKSDLNSEQPKKSYYDNADAYNKMRKDKDVKDLYDILIEEMQNAQKNYQTTNRRFNYQLPQVNAHTMQILSRLYKQGVRDTLTALYQSATTVEENDESMRTSEDYITNPDGTVATDVPLKFVRKLKHPEMITTDIAGSVILFANMALNYKNKSEIDAKIKAIRYNLDFKNREDLYKNSEDTDELPPYDNENSIKMFDSMTNKHVYGNQWTTNPNQPQSLSNTNGGSWSTVLKHVLGEAAGGAIMGATMYGLPTGDFGTGALVGGIAGGMLGTVTGAIQGGLLEGVAFFKTMKNIQRLETTQMLALNIYSMLVGFGDSSVRIMKESMMNKYMSVRDVLTSFVSVIRYTPQCIANIGNPLANNKLTRAMQLNGVSKGTHQIYEHLNYGRGRRIASNLLMGGFSMLDWMANALLLRSFYNNIRFYDGDVIPKGFYSAYEIEQEFIKAGKSVHAAKLAHMMCTRTLWGAYDNNMELKPEYEPYVNLRIKTLVRTKTLKRGALYNGMNPDNDIPRWKQDLIGSVIGALRSWLAQSTQHLVAGGTDNIVREVETEETPDVIGTNTKIKKRRKYKSMTPEQKARAFAWDYETGTPQDQIWVGIFRSLKTLLNKMQYLVTLGYAGVNQKLSYVEKYAWKDAIIYIGVLAAMMYGWTFINDDANTIEAPTERKQAAPESLAPSDVYDYFANQYIPNEYWKLQMNTIAFRLIEALITSIDPSSASDVANSVTALKSGLGEHLGILNALSDISGASGHTLDEVNKRGSYKFYTRGERAAYKFIGPLDNLHTAFTYYGTTLNLGFYTNTYGGIYRWFGYDFKKPEEKKNLSGFSGGNFSGGNFSGGNFSGGNFGGGNFK